MLCVLLAASNKSKQCGFGNLVLVGSLMFFEMTVSFCLGETVTKTSIKSMVVRQVTLLNHIKSQ